MYYYHRYELMPGQRPRYLQTICELGIRSDYQDEETAKVAFASWKPPFGQKSDWPNVRFEHWNNPEPPDLTLIEGIQASWAREYQKAVEFMVMWHEAHHQDERKRSVKEEPAAE